MSAPTRAPASAPIPAADWLAARARLSPERIGTVCGDSGQRRSYAAWNDDANRTANFLRSLGVGKGERVSVYARNCTAYLDVLFACGKLGAILHTINWRLTSAEIAKLLSDGGPRVLVFTSDFRAEIEALRPALSDIGARAQAPVALVSVPFPAGPENGPENGGESDGGDDDDDGESVHTSDNGVIAWSQREQHPTSFTGPGDLSSDDPWVIFYTGGTTGLPKGAVLTHGNLAWHSINTVMSWGLTAEHSAPVQLPMFHVGGINLFMMPMVHVGGTTVVCSGFDAEQTFDLIGNGDITHYVAVPTMYLLMQQHARWADTDFSRLALVISGGAPCPLPVMEAFWARGVDFKMGYGLTEASGNNFWLRPAEVRARSGSVGVPLFHVDAKIAAEDGSELPAGETGELWLRGPHVMAGYWRRPDASAESLVDGWLRTGDLARCDDDGFFYIMGRSKDMYISGGENVYPAEIESALHAHPAVAEAAVVGVPHETWGEVGCAFVVREPGNDAVAGEELIAYLRERLAKYKCPRQVVFLAELPKTAVGKLDKKQLTARAASS
ncbi:acyl-CoA synthetase [Haliangium ochraceum]|uniref:AMP-dependent synthetase and ligase n=1 Tax=Haliangium ochraceum (strain DSM 14365 / JCM 11303 / SMP-2) TaxID=502025 RepID=D0LYS0_HALO1|nr:long-chain fatty acid--CoA ligase [Haliangium ochraceum]ACY17936.1 AMP-dependent synthetase and ligase [Haliangium ochraceum DSM 14365]